MCSHCGWLELAFRIEQHLDQAFVAPGAFVLETASRVILANEHATPDQVDAIEAVLEHREGAHS